MVGGDAATWVDGFLTGLLGAAVVWGVGRLLDVWREKGVRNGE